MCHEPQNGELAGKNLRSSRIALARDLPAAVLFAFFSAAQPFPALHVVALDKNIDEENNFLCSSPLRRSGCISSKECASSSQAVSVKPNLQMARHPEFLVKNRDGANCL